MPWSLFFKVHGTFFVWFLVGQDRVPVVISMRKREEPAGVLTAKSDRFKPALAATDANWRLWRFNRQIEKPRKTSKKNHRPSCPQKTAVTSSKAVRRRPPYMTTAHGQWPVEVAFFGLFYLFFPLRFRRKFHLAAHVPRRGATPKQAPVIKRRKSHVKRFCVVFVSV